MLHDSVHPEKVVDAEAAREFMLEATKLATATELEDVGQRLESKGRLFQEILAPDVIGTLDEEGFERLSGTIFSIRRKAGRLIRANGFDRIRAELGELLHAERPIAQRFDRFTSSIQGLEPAMIISLASEALHFSKPERHWLWTHWIWNPGTGTGALALVTQDRAELEASSNGEVYRRVGQATALLNAHGHEVGLSRAGRGLYGTDVFLASVYAVYMFTVFRVKLSQEFNRILPELPELVRRVLGVNKMEEADGS